MTKAVGKSTAMEMVLTGRNFSADDAERRGLISRVVREGSVVDEAVKVASTIAKKGQIAVQAAKEGVNACEYALVREAFMPLTRQARPGSCEACTDGNLVSSCPFLPPIQLYDDDNAVMCRPQQPSNSACKREPASNVVSSRASSLPRTRRKAWRLSPKRGRPLLRTSRPIPQSQAPPSCYITMDHGHAV